MSAEGTLQERLRAVLDGWMAYVEAHGYAWRMLFRDTGGGARVQAFRTEVQSEAVVDAITGAWTGLLAP